MKVFTLEIKPQAFKDLSKVPKPDQKKILQKISKLESGVTGDVKKLTKFNPEYRLRVGNYRILFDIDEDQIIIYRILHRKDAYQ